MDMIGFVLRGDSESQKYMIQANLSFLDLCEYAEFTQMTDINDDPYDAGGKATEDFYQRRVDEDRVKRIMEYIKSSILSSESTTSIALFPTAMLLATYWEEPLQIGGMCEIKNFYQNIPSLYIVDGQHRLYSMKKLYEQCKSGKTRDDARIVEYLENYSFNSTILINFDMWEQAQVFADVNFNQHKVDKSLYYSIYGLDLYETNGDITKTKIYLAHQLTKFMNLYDQSPLKRNIKMLGTGRGFVSQAFFADSLIRNFSPRGIWSKKLEMDNAGNYQDISRELVSFFVAVKEVFADSWPTENGEHRSIIAKTTGIGALIRLMAYLHRIVLSDNIKYALREGSDDRICLKYINAIKPELEIIKAFDLFDFDGAFSGTGGRGLEVKLYKKMIDCITDIAENELVDFDDWVDCCAPEGPDEIEALYYAVECCDDYGLYEMKNRDQHTSQWIVKSSFIDSILVLPTLKRRKLFLKYIEDRFCDGEDVHGWCAFTRAAEKDD